jgi:DNA-binding SARP family transcriptional activator
MRANLCTYMAGLRRILSNPGDRHRIVSHPQGYRLVVHSEEFDLASFEECRNEGVRAEQSSDFAGAARRYAQALASWRGDLLDGLLTVGPALRAEAERLHERRLTVVERSVEVRC